jgi:hypothetical protein
VLRERDWLVGGRRRSRGRARGRGEVDADGVLVDVVAAGFELGWVEDEVVGKAALPDGRL